MGTLVHVPGALAAKDMKKPKTLNAFLTSAFAELVSPNKPMDKLPKYRLDKWKVRWIANSLSCWGPQE